MGTSIKISFDDFSNVLYAKREGARVITARDADEDPRLILSMSADGSVVGLQLLDASTIDQDWWQHHPSRNAIPADIFLAIDRWLTNRHRPARTSVG